jgi:hypothetical protein
MSRVTAAFVCALCDPDNPRPASIMCSNNCGRYVCAVHATPRKGPGSAMICVACAEALGLIEKPKPKPVPEVRPLIEIPTEPTPAPEPVEAPPIAPVAVAAVETTPPAPEPVAAVVEPAAAAVMVEDVTVVTPKVAAPPPKEPIVVDQVTPLEPRSAVRLTETEPAPKSAASETIVSQRGNTLQVPKVSPALGKPPQPIAPKPRKAQRTSEEGGSQIDWKLIGMIAGTVALGVLGFILILAALAG